MSEPKWAALFDKRVAELDGRFKRAGSGGGCYNCGCPNVQYVRHLDDKDAVAVYLASPEAERALAEAERVVNRQPQYSCTVDHRDGEGSSVGCPDEPTRRRRAILAAMREAK